MPPSCNASEVEISLARLEMQVYWLSIQQKTKSNLKMTMTSFSLTSVQIVKTTWLASRAQTWRTFWDTWIKESGPQSLASEALCNCSHTRLKTWSNRDRTSSSLHVNPSSRKSVLSQSLTSATQPRSDSLSRWKKTLPSIRHRNRKSLSFGMQSHSSLPAHSYRESVPCSIISTCLTRSTLHLWSRPYKKTHRKKTIWWWLSL